MKTTAASYASAFLLSLLLTTTAFAEKQVITATDQNAGIVIQHSESPLEEGTEAIDSFAEESDELDLDAILAQEIEITDAEQAQETGLEPQMADEEEIIDSIASEEATMPEGEATASNEPEVMIAEDEIVASDAASEAVEIDAEIINSDPLDLENAELYVAQHPAAEPAPSISIVVWGLIAAVVLVLFTSVVWHMMRRRTELKKIDIPLDME
jgi:cobalamin biosynthesis Mg chelatase CobN